MERQPNSSQSNVPTIQVTLLSALLGEQIPFTVPATMQVSHFIHHLIDSLSQREDGEAFRTMLRYYEPALELVGTEGDGHEVSSQITLADAGFHDGSQCRLAAHPIKSEQLFCRHCG